MFSSFSSRGHRAVMVWLISGLLVGSAFAAEFAYKGTYPTGSQLYTLSMVAADFNGDGIMDLAAANEDTDTIGVLMGLGGGTFAPVVTYPVGFSPTSIAASDVNLDGKIDLVVSVPNDLSAIDVLLGNGDGTFQGAVGYGGDHNVGLMVCADFNNDGAPDVVAMGNGEAWVFLNDGNGSFGSPTSYFANSFAGTLAAGDFNGDGNLDIAIANYGNGKGLDVSVLLGTGDGSFQGPTNFPTRLGPDSIAVGDFNKDGKLDIVTGQQSSLGGVAVLLGNGDGSFQNPKGYAPGVPFVYVAVADFNQDGTADIAGTGLTSVLLGRGDGTFVNPSSYTDTFIAFGLIAADLTNDGYPDLVIVNGASIVLNISHDPIAFFAPKQLTFGGTKLGNISSPQHVTLTNSGYNPLAISSIASAETSWKRTTVRRALPSAIAAPSRWPSVREVWASATAN